MYYYLDGTVTYCDPKLIVVDCNGVGYGVMPTSAVVAKARVGQKMKVYTCLHVREDALELYGFADLEEKNCFLMLTAISGVGPKVAMAILSVTTPTQLAMSILNEDEKAITSAPGVGKKLAQRIILELKDKLAKQMPAATDFGGVPGEVLSGGSAESAVSALVVLGYSVAEARKAVAKVDTTGLTTEEIVRRALKTIGD